MDDKETPRERPSLLIEDWLPVKELGIESIRERAVVSSMPPLSLLHVWWARRPLVASAGVILASVMPTWTPELAIEFSDIPEVSSQKEYHLWVLRLCGILGDPIAAKRAQVEAIEKGARIANPFTYKQAFKNSPTVNDVAKLHRILIATWGKLPEVIDPTAGGGSIPCEAIRYGLPATGNDLNPIATSVLKAGIQIPAQYGLKIVPHLEKYGKELSSNMEKRLTKFFPNSNANEKVATYIFARTVACPRTGKMVPLSPNWWLRGGGEEERVAVRLVTERNGTQLAAPEFEVVFGNDIDFDPDAGTVKRGVGVSPWDGQSIEGDYIKTEAQAGRMGSVLYAVATRVEKKHSFRAPTKTDLDALASAEKELARLMPQWLKDDVLPIEEIPVGNETNRPHNFGMKKWQDMFSTRQLLVHGTFVEEFRKIIPKIEEELDDDEANAVLSLLPIMGGKAVNINSMLSTWDTTRQKIRSVFDTHNFAFKWTFAEFEGAQELFTWLSGSLVGAYSGISNLLAFSGEDSLDAPDDVPPKSVPVVIHGSAANLQTIEDDSQTLVCIDPPYGDNVMYAELSDFFYVWEKRTLGKVNPDFFKEELTDKANEAVTNVARFADSGKRKKELANQDYEMKMTAIFDECHRVLADNGVLSIMFTHKDAAAWDNLGMSLMDAGFTIETSWPVPTESEQSLHQKGLNSAASTIMLVCRKRPERDATEVFFEDIEGDVRDAAREASARFEALGITGVDLMLSTYGPALSVVSNNWPVYSSEPDPITGASRLLKPEEALTTAREELTRIQRKRLVGRDVQFHPYTDFTILCWDLFGAPAFPFDEARRLALAVGGLDMNELAKDGKILEKKGGNVRLLSPSERLRRDADFDKGLSGVYPNASSLPPIGIDAVHTAMYIAEHDGPAAAKAWMDKVGAAGNPKFMGALQAMLNAVPRSKTKGEWNYPEAEQLDALAFYFDDLRVPEVDEPVAIEEPEQQSFELGD